MGTFPQGQRLNVSRFDELVQRAVADMERCIKARGLRACAFTSDRALSGPNIVQTYIYHTLYHTFIKSVTLMVAYNRFMYNDYFVRVAKKTTVLRN